MSASMILVVDDEPDVEALVNQKFRRQIRSGELAFVFAYDGKNALEVLQDEPDITMVLSDINMPRMDGLALLEQLNERHEEIKTVIVSAYGDMGNIRTAMNRGAFDFITKPIEFDDLEATIAKTLAHLKVMHNLQQEKANAERAMMTLSRYFSPHVAEALSENPDCLAPGGARRFATFMFTDLADFTHLVETTDPDIIVTLLNEYVDELAKIIFEHDGTVMKVVGDALHAAFGAPLDQPDHAERAVACALEIDKFASRLQAEWIGRGVPLGVTRIGINSGQAIVGNFGGDNFFDYTAHGDAVNVAARLESANKQFGTRMCVSQSVADQIPDFQGRPVGILLLQGKSQTLNAFEPLSSEQFSSPGTAAYLQAYQKLEAGDPGARQAFAALVGQSDDDYLAMFHLGRLLAGESGVELELTKK
jgi:adenylate cyclase